MASAQVSRPSVFYKSYPKLSYRRLEAIMTKAATEASRHLVADRIRLAAAGGGPGMVHRLTGFEQFHTQGRLPPGRNKHENENRSCANARTGAHADWRHADDGRTGRGGTKCSAAQAERSM